jgi:hypothetical protein
MSATSRNGVSAPAWPGSGTRTPLGTQQRRTELPGDAGRRVLACCIFVCSTGILGTPAELRAQTNQLFYNTRVILLRRLHNTNLTIMITSATVSVSRCVCITTVVYHERQHLVPLKRLQGSFRNALTSYTHTGRRKRRTRQSSELDGR